MPKILITLLSELHFEDAQMIQARQKRKLLKHHNIPVLVGLENPVDYTFQFVKDKSLCSMKLTENLELIEQHIPKQKFQDYIKQKKIPQDIYENDKLTLANRKAFLDLLLDLEKEEASPDKNFLCIDFPRIEEEKFDKELAAAVQTNDSFLENMVYVKWFIPRARSMANNLLSMIKTLKERGGVILVVGLGEMHVHRVAALLDEKLKQESLPKDLDIEIVPTKIQTKNENTVSAKARAQFNPWYKLGLLRDSSTSLEYYKTHPCLELNYVPSDKNGYDCKQLDELFQRFITEYNTLALSPEKPLLFDGGQSLAKKCDAGDSKQNVETATAVSADPKSLYKDTYIKMAENLLGEQFKERYAKISQVRLWQLDESNPKNNTLTLNFIKLRDDTKKWFEMQLASVINFVKFIEAEDGKARFYRVQFQNIEGLHKQLAGEVASLAKPSLIP